MTSNRIVYQNWIVDLGRDPAQAPEPLTPERQFGAQGIDAPEVERRNRIEEAVGAALGKLDDNECEFIERYYFMGQSFGEIAAMSGRLVHRLEALHRRAVRKLRKNLAPLVAEMFDLRTDSRPDCLICQSSERACIDRLIAERDRAGTWRPVMKQIRDDYGVRIRSPQILIGHEKYH